MFHGQRLQHQSFRSFVCFAFIFHRTEQHQLNASIVGADKKLIRVATLANMKVRPDANGVDCIRSVREVVEQLQRLAARINDCFGKQVVFSLLSAFICVTVQLYYLLNHIESGFAYNGWEIYTAAACSLLVLHGVEFWTLFSSGEAARRSWHELIRYLYQMKSKSSEEDFRRKVSVHVSENVRRPC